MAIIKPFKGLRPPKEIVEEVACLPYDVMNSEEAAKMASGKKASLLHITRAEIEFEKGTDSHAEKVYLQAKSNFKDFQDKKYLIQDNEAKYYIYAQTMNGKTQYGIVGAASCQDYLNGVIKKHELTRPDKEEDRKVLSRILEANIEPVFFTYRAVPEIDAIVSDIITNNEAEYDFTSEDGFGHHFWVIKDAETNKELEKLFKDNQIYDIAELRKTLKNQQAKYQDLTTQFLTKGEKMISTKHNKENEIRNNDEPTKFQIKKFK